MKKKKSRDVAGIRDNEKWTAGNMMVKVRSKREARETRKVDRSQLREVMKY